MAKASFQVEIANSNDGKLLRGLTNNKVDFISIEHWDKSIIMCSN